MVFSLEEIWTYFYHEMDKRQLIQEKLREMEERENAELEESESSEDEKLSSDDDF